MRKANIVIDEATVVGLLAQAVGRRIGRDFDTRDDIRSNNEMLRDAIQGAGVADLKAYLLEMLDGNTHGIHPTYHIEVTSDREAVFR